MELKQTYFRRCISCTYFEVCTRNGCSPHNSLCRTKKRSEWGSKGSKQRLFWIEWKGCHHKRSQSQIQWRVLAFATRTFRHASIWSSLSYERVFTHTSGSPHILKFRKNSTFFLFCPYAGSELVCQLRFSLHPPSHKGREKIDRQVKYPEMKTRKERITLIKTPDYHISTFSKKGGNRTTRDTVFYSGPKKRKTKGRPSHF